MYVCTYVEICTCMHTIADVCNCRQIPTSCLLAGYPSTAEELEELASEGLLTMADAWISVHLAGDRA